MITNVKSYTFSRIRLKNSHINPRIGRCCKVNLAVIPVVDDRLQRIFLVSGPPFCFLVHLKNICLAYFYYFSRRIAEITKRWTLFI